jgi:putative membrane protein
MQPPEEVMVLKKISSSFIILSSPLVFAFAQGPNGTMGYGGHMMGYGYGGGFMWLILLLVFVAVGIYFLLQFKKSKGFDSSTIETPLDILKKRYANGEIDKEEFERRRSDVEP